MEEGNKFASLKIEIQEPKGIHKSGDLLFLIDFCSGRSPWPAKAQVECTQTRLCAEKGVNYIPAT